MFPKGTEWIIILVIALLIFGPKNLPKLGASLGKTVKNIREGMSGDDSATEEEPESEEDKEIRELEEKLAEAKKAKADKDESSADED